VYAQRLCDIEVLQLTQLLTKTQRRHGILHEFCHLIGNQSLPIAIVMLKPFTDSQRVAIRQAVRVSWSML
jgi:hypothetical protein